MANTRRNIRMKFGDYVLSDDFICLVKSRPLPEFKPSSTSVDGADGESFDALTLGTRTFAIIVVFKPEQTRKQRHELARKLAGELLTRKPKRFIFTDENADDGTQLYRMAVPVGVVDVEEFVNTERWTIEFVQHDPYRYKSGAMSTAKLKAKEWTEVIVGGNAPAFPIVKAKPTGTHYTIRTNAKNTRVKYSADFGNTGTNQLTIDFKELTAKTDKTISGAAGLSTDSKFFTFSGTMNLYATDTTVISWRERYI